ncbi:low temperature requirement protein A [Tessaracoccus sp. HDW20]|uniref:low temperature requirement protein A n=1 Tax=Tessaracoccus coleopterorum TaxID=2714950 RepID=UPI0018D4BAB7|nr:low temperature requirement protein A [Tessaracoccus coleopterorum]NHB84743.1 low temperature requirement protein A [Tessaracoccus coleopterorum]
MTPAEGPTTAVGHRSPHGLLPMRGRDPGEQGRAGSPLELIFDLIAVVAVSIASSNLARLLDEGHIVTGIGTFLFAVFAITWAWSTYSQLLSAFDTDDWGVRLITLMQMVGVLLLALGLGPMVASIDSGGLDNKVMVLGYVVMRVGAIIVWLRVARVSGRYRVMATAYVRALVISQVGWCLQAFLPIPPRIALTVMGVWLVQEVLYPVLAERRQQMPWHPEHMAERLGAFTIITLGEVVLGTVTAVQADVDGFGWNATAIAVAVAGLGLAFGLWWLYFILPCGELLGLRPRRLHAVILLHILLYASIAAVGAGLHLSASFVEGSRAPPGSLWRWPSRSPRPRWCCSPSPTSPPCSAGLTPSMACCWR